MDRRKERREKREMKDRKINEQNMERGMNEENLVKRDMREMSQEIKKRNKANLWEKWVKKLSTEVKKGWEIKKKRRLGKSDTIVEMKGRLRGASKASKLKRRIGRKITERERGT